MAGKVLAFPELRGSLDGMVYPAFVEPKIDGEFNVLFWDEIANEAWLCNKYGRIRKDLPFILDFAGVMRGRKVKSATFLGELYTGTGCNGQLYHLLKNKNNFNELKYKLFDFGHITFKDRGFEGGKTLLIERKEIILEMLMNSATIGLPIMSKMVNDKTEVFDEFTSWTDKGYEGIVVKPSLSYLQYGPCSWVKIKDKDRNDYEVVLIDPVKERIEIKAPVCDPLGKPLAYINVGVKCSNKDKQNLAVGDFVTIEHQGVLLSGSLRHPVFIRKTTNVITLIPGGG